MGVGPGNVIYVVEVKSSRSDFSRDNHTAEDFAALQVQGAVVAGRTQLAKETLLQVTSYAQRVRPKGWRDVAAYRQALKDFRKQLHNERAYEARVAAYSIKFHDRRFLAIADYHYILAPRGTVGHRRLPPQWGLLEDSPKVVVAAPKKTIRKSAGIVSNVLRAIASSNAASMMRAQGVLPTEDGTAFLNGNGKVPKDGSVLRGSLGRSKLKAESSALTA